MTKCPIMILGLLGNGSKSQHVTTSIIDGLLDSSLTAQSKSAYRVSHGIGPTLFFAILSVSTLPKYKNLVSVKKFRKFAIR